MAATDKNQKLNEKIANKFLELAETNLEINFQPTFLLPGDVPNLHNSSKSTQVTLGWGLKQSPIPRAFSAGMLKYCPHATANLYWVENIGRRKYFPFDQIESSGSPIPGKNMKETDQVVGIIEERGGDYYVVNVFSGTHCILNRLAFEGATKRNKPELKRGDVIYARVIATNNGDMEISCLAPGNIKKDWTTGETVIIG